MKSEAKMNGESKTKTALGKLFCFKIFMQLIHEVIVLKTIFSFKNAQNFSFTSNSSIQRILQQ